jgi:hypothetical protein
MLDWIGVSKHNGDLRVIASAIMGSVGTAYTAIEAVKGFLQGRTSVSKIKNRVRTSRRSSIFWRDCDEEPRSEMPGDSGRLDVILHRKSSVVREELFLGSCEFSQKRGKSAIGSAMISFPSR